MQNIDTITGRLNSNGSKFIVSNLTEYHKQVDFSPLSIKLVTHGRENYRINNKGYALESGRYLIVNKGDELKVDVTSSEVTQGICIYPPKNLLEEVFQYHSLSQNQLLEKEGSIEKRFQFTGNSTDLKTTHTGRFLNKNLPSILQNHSHTDFNSIYTELAEHMIHDQLLLNKQLRQLASSKKQTQEELYRRLTDARDFIHAHFDQKLQIDELAAVACLSKYHFLRSFKSLFNCSPYQYALQLKLNAAKELLAQDYSYNQISVQVGFSDPKNLRKALRNLS